jgi:nitrous oxidase accessory protein NosD
MLRSKIIHIALGVAGMLVAAAHARAAILLVDDDNVPCPAAPFRNINQALAVANADDEIQVCPGLYVEQVVLTKPLTLRGLPVGNQKAVLMPPELLASRPSTIGGKLITAGILVDARKVVIDSLVVDMSAANVSGCSPVVTGLYLRAASGPVSNVEVRGAHATAPLDCDTGVGLLVEGGQIGDIFGNPILGKAVVSIRDSEFTNNQKGGIVVLGDGAVVKIRASQVLGDGLAAVQVQNGIELSGGVKARVQDAQIRDFQTAVAGKTATGVLLFGAKRVRLRHTTMTAVQTGVFVVGDRARILDSQIGDITSDGIVFLGDKNRALGNLIDVSSVSGVFIDGDHNTVRGGNMTDMPVGVWFFDGDRNLARGIDFENVPEPERVGGVRTLTSDAVDPFSLDCASAADCDDGNPCTTDACDATTGVCSATAVANFTPCADSTICNGNEVCLTGVCQPGTPLVCVDGLECTQDLICDATLGCQFPPVTDGTSCNGGTGSCTAGVCS